MMRLTLIRCGCSVDGGSTSSAAVLNDRFMRMAHRGPGDGTQTEVGEHAFGQGFRAGVWSLFKTDGERNSTQTKADKWSSLASSRHSALHNVEKGSEQPHHW
jgi:hypothetical protein